MRTCDLCTELVASVDELSVLGFVLHRECAAELAEQMLRIRAEQRHQKPMTELSSI